MDWSGRRESFEDGERLESNNGKEVEKMVTRTKKTRKKKPALGYKTDHLVSRELLSEPLRPIQIHSLPAKQSLNVLGLGYTVAVVRVVFVLLVSLLGSLGYMQEAVSVVASLHFTFSLTPLGILAGLAETALWGFLMGLLFGWVYNLVTPRRGE
ncbi:hypothetical protein HY496_03460 [Candidatus Woesearchaeota archaeon]|nr:hypothetical protein [Candidatus Woesearchaeota archaeon]